MAPSVAGPLLPSPPTAIGYRSKYCAKNSANHPLQWHVVLQLSSQLRTLAVQQLIRNWRQYETMDGCEALWGDEIEYFLAQLKEGSSAKPLLEQARVLKTLASSQSASCFQPEFGKCCVESNPLAPYSPALEDLLEVELNMKERRSMIKDALRPGEAVLTLTAFPNFGLQDIPADKIVSEAAPAYLLSKQNLLLRRQRKWWMQIPIFQDENMPSTSSDLISENSVEAPQDYVTIDDFNFAGCQCCMQITMQANNIREARNLYDQFIPLSPIMLALTAATPIYKRRLVNTDVRWNLQNALFDDRSPKELAQEHNRRSRWCPNSTYLAPGSQAFADASLPVNAQVLDSLLAGGMDEPLARHFSHVMNWDPVKLMTSDIEDKGDNVTTLFELFNNSYYQGVRFKPPPGGANHNNVGWRVEFRTMEVQPTDFENAAFAIFIYLVSRVIVEFNLKLYLPLDKVAENFDRAHTVNAAVENKFWFRTLEWCSGNNESSTISAEPSVFDLITIDEIINGPQKQAEAASSFRFPGFIPLIKLYLARRQPAPQTERQIYRYLDLIAARASGESPTAATWMRDFVRTHPDYQGDSVVPESTVFDLLSEVDAMAAV